MKEILPLDIFSKILHHSQNMREINGLFLKNTSSGGGLFPIDLYIFTNNVEKMDHSIYKYQSISNSLCLVRENCKKEVFEILSNQEGIDLENKWQWLKSIRFKLPIIEKDLCIGLDNDEHVEMFCLLINQNAKANHHVNVDIDAEDYYKIKEDK